MTIWKPIETIPRGKIVLIRRRVADLTGSEPQDGWYYNTASTMRKDNWLSRWADEWAEIPSDEDRIGSALEIIGACGGHDGAHHKQWVLDQVVRALTADGYPQWVANHNVGEDGPDTYSWDEGTPP